MTERDRAQPRYAGDVLRAQEKHVQIVSQNKYFTYDHVFGNDTHQGDIFTALGERPVQKFVEGKIDNKRASYSYFAYFLFIQVTMSLCLLM